MPERDNALPVVVIGAGPAGLTAALELTRHGWPTIVLEKLATVGGIARTEEFKGFCFDMGGHRFFTKEPEIEKLWRELLPSDFLRRPRLSRIFYRGRFFRYPLRLGDALRGLGPWQGLLIALSYLRWRCAPYRREDTFEQWVTNRFGRRLFLTFFKTYTEKVWGLPCSELRAEWAAQRIKDLSFRTALLAMFVKPRQRIRTLIDEFHYPRRGPGMLWQAAREAVERTGGRVRLEREVVAVWRDGARVESVTVAGPGGMETIRGQHFISTMPITEFVAKLVPAAPPEVLAAASRLRYRSLITVGLIVDRAEVFRDNWIYVHTPEVRVGRIQNFKNWSADMVPDQAQSGVGLEYFASVGDDLWSMSDRDLVELAKRELDRLGLARYAEIVDGCVFRVPSAYPVYDSTYRGALATVRTFVAQLENVQTIGRNGLHRYDNQDHAMLTGLLAARNVATGAGHDVWGVNTDRGYHEEVAVVADRTAEDAATAPAFTRLDSIAFGAAVGSVGALCLPVVTLHLALAGSARAVALASLLAHFFPGYSVSLSGSVLGVAYGASAGFVGGWGFAALRNLVLFVYLAVVHRRADWQALSRVLDYV